MATHHSNQPTSPTSKTLDHPQLYRGLLPKEVLDLLGKETFFQTLLARRFAPVEGGRPCRIGYRQMTALNELMAQTGSCLAIGIPLANSTEF